MEFGQVEKRNTKKDKRKERKKHPYRHLGTDRSMDLSEDRINS